MSNITFRIWRKFRAEGVAGLAAAIRGRYRRRVAEIQARSPVAWAAHGWASLWLARAWRPRQPAVLILSVPRSGSTWVGEMLGSASDALYLEEPLNRPAISGGFPYYFDSPAPQPPPQFNHLAALAFAGCPAFDSWVVRFPQQWALARRWRSRLVIKDVNPRLVEWLARAYRPRLILLVRHPAAVTASFRNLNWWSSAPDAWSYQGQRQGAALRAALQALRDYPDHRIVQYEDLCADPLPIFRELFDFAGLRWDVAVEDRVQARSAGDASSNPWGTLRDSRSMIDAWRGQVTAAQAQQVRAAYAAFDLPWYRSDDDW